jgi:protein-S-isoprenylcysteine O-methyltransferase Ste14
VGARLFRWLGALLFLCSLGYFLLSYMTTYGAPTTGGAASVAVVWNVTIFTLFALHHSVCARKPVRLWIARLVPASLERSTYIWIASLLLIAVGGVWLGLRSAAILDVWELTGLADAGNVRPPSAQDNSSRVLAGTQPPAVEFTTTGPYGWIRHPI